MVARVPHYRLSSSTERILSPNVKILSSIKDPSTIRPWINLIEAIKIRSFIALYKIDILHILYAEPNSLWVNWKWVFRRPVVITTHGTDILKTIPAFFSRKSLLDRVITWQYRKALSHADHIICTSTSQVESMNRIGIGRSATVARTGISIGLIESSTKDVAKELGIRAPFVLMPRNMRPLYNHEFTLEAISILSAHIREEFTFVFLNADTHDRWYFEKIREKASCIQANVMFIESLAHRDLISLVKQSSLIVMNPHSDGSPVSAMEAIACEVPVILPPLAYDKDVFGEVFTFDTWHVEALRDLIQKILAMDNDIRSNRIRCLKDRIFRHGNMEIEMMKVYGIYNELLNDV